MSPHLFTADCRGQTAWSAVFRIDHAMRLEQLRRPAQPYLLDCQHIDCPVQDPPSFVRWRLQKYCFQMKKFNASETTPIRSTMGILRRWAGNPTMYSNCARVAGQADYHRKRNNTVVGWMILLLNPSCAYALQPSSFLPETPFPPPQPTSNKAGFLRARPPCQVFPVDCFRRLQKLIGQMQTFLAHE